VSILVCGSMAFDSIMVFHDYFKNHIMPDQIHKLSVAFYVPDMEKNFGGTAGNIGYNLNLIKANFKIMSTVGKDFEPYQSWLTKNNIATNFIKLCNDDFTAQAFITTDLDDNQITAFHPGAMSKSHLNTIMDIKENIQLILISPDGKEGMIEHAEQSFKCGIPFIFDPGQGLPMFDKDELLNFINKASFITVNDYEAEMLSKNSGLSFQEISNQVNALIITKGASGSVIITNGNELNIPAFKVPDPIDPTGCGDAYRAGIAYGITHHWDWNKTGLLASALAALKVKSKGGQNHNPTISDIENLTGFKLND
jgi:adenosine kinase